ncbi:MULTISPECIES: pyridoxal 5'-phosphate synthase glutaminase subunit PdxT [unclassified Rathayibacter]|uniref:pyridoxal 5'-phosphate synthase glutaminase subunit PdxT n=1 Tax=Rathayibacter sp. Leaf296 TaxID=1736327 RepID=UPI0007031344|nr:MULTISPECIES: pyridoxal 5'-phosphate synthase glutaminase subunit PdxT [unclassified Rathayibacter]KQQ11147.1 glutamine amidotransferase [Rathayibacter sp. Leaf296]OOB91989.1 glutamine amidotransferase subunit PdxT [Rathayibacter sp. VKM Ac-2630]
MAGSTGPRVAGEGETRESLEGLRVGVLALQGDFREHAAVLRELGAEVVLVRRPAELASVAGLVIPGGESTVMDKLSRLFGLAEPIGEAIEAGLPVYGTCAGLIMLADRVLDRIEGQHSFGGLDVTVRRNAFGNQLDSFETDLDVPVIGDPPVHAVFIRAPIVEELGERATALAAIADGRVVAVEQGNLMGTSFHPEITGDYRFHELFLRKVAATRFGA